MKRIRPVDWAAQQRVGSAAAKCTLLAICARAEGLTATVPLGVLAEVTEQSVQVVREQLDYLEQRGLISRTGVFVLDIRLPVQAIAVELT